MKAILGFILDVIIDSLMLGVGIVLLLSCAILTILSSSIWKGFLLALVTGIIFYLLILDVMTVVMNYKDALRK